MRDANTPLPVLPTSQAEGRVMAAAATAVSAVAALADTASPEPAPVVIPLQPDEVRAVVAATARVFEGLADTLGRLEENVHGQRQLLDRHTPNGQHDPQTSTTDHAAAKAEVYLRMAMAEARDGVNWLRAATQALDG